MFKCHCKLLYDCKEMPMRSLIAIVEENLLQALWISCAAYDLADNMWTCEESAIIVKALVESMEKRVGESGDVSLDFVHQVC